MSIDEPWPTPYTILTHKGLSVYDKKAHEYRLIKVELDEDPMSPRDADHITHLETWHPRWSSPDPQTARTPYELLANLLHACFKSSTFLLYEVTNRFGWYTISIENKDDEHHGDYRFFEKKADIGPDHRPPNIKTNLMCGDTLISEDVGYNPDQLFLDVALQVRPTVEILSAYMPIRTIYMLDHSGITYSTVPFSNRWDSGPVGFAYILPEDISKICPYTPHHDWTQYRIRQGNAMLDADVSEWDAYANGDTFIFSAYNKKTDELIDSVGSIIGDTAEATQAAIYALGLDVE